MIKFRWMGSVGSAPIHPRQTALGELEMSETLVIDGGDKPQLESSLKGEVWKPVPSEDGVLASSKGRILLPPRYAPMHHGGFRGHFPKPRFGQISRERVGAKHDYRIIMVRDTSKPARQRPRKVHQLVCEAFHGPKPFEKAVVIHLDEDAHNNRPENLMWGTQKENLTTYRTRPDHTPEVRA